jgi:hypothetical protein
MGSPFKMNPKTPLMKVLVGKQGNLPQQLQDAIKAAPARKVDNKKFAEAKDYVDGETKTTTKDIGKGRTLTTKKRSVKKIVAPKGRDEMSAAEKKSADIMAKRQGGGRIGTETTQTVSQKGVKGNTTTSTAYAGTEKDASGRTKYRTLSDGTKVVVEGTVSAIKPRGIDTGKKKSKGKSPAKSYGKSPVKSTGGKKKLGTEGMSYKEKVAYYEKQKKAKQTKNPKISMGMGTSYTTIKK